MKSRAIAQTLCHLWDGQPIFEAQLEQETIAWFQPLEHAHQCSIRLCGSQCILWAWRLAVAERAEIHFGADEIDQAPTGCSLRIPNQPPARVAATAVAMAVMIETDSLSDYDEPGGELASTIGDERPETMRVVNAQLFYDTCIRVRGTVVVPPEPPRYMEQQGAVFDEELRPRLLENGGLSRVE